MNGKALRRLCLVISLGVLLPAARLSAQDSQPAANSEPAIAVARSGETISVAELASRSSDCDVLFLGEIHDNEAGHRFQLDVIQALVEQGHNVVVSMEQFERDVQGVVDDYLAGRIDEQAFLAESRPWKNYAEHYRPIVEFCKEQRIPVLAANVPRRLASDMATGKLISLADQVFLPRSTSATEDLYWQKFQETMKGHGGVDQPEQLTNFYKSQCLKDDCMAESITDYLATNSHKRKTVVHLCGNFHSDYGLGTAARVVQRRPLARIVVVTMEIPESDESKTSDLPDRGHYVFRTKKNEPTPVEPVADEI